MKTNLTAEQKKALIENPLEAFRALLEEFNNPKEEEEWEAYDSHNNRIQPGTLGG